MWMCLAFAPYAASNVFVNLSALVKLGLMAWLSTRSLIGLLTRTLSIVWDDNNFHFDSRPTPLGKSEAVPRSASPCDVQHTALALASWIIC